MSANSALKNLHTALLDTKQGYETAAKDVDDPTLKRAFDDMIRLRTEDHDELHAALAKLGDEPDDGGSFMGTVHKTVVGTRAAITGIDRAALAAFADGEDRVLNDYDAARDEQAAAGRAEITKMLDRQRGIVAEKAQALRQMSEG